MATNPYEIGQAQNGLRVSVNYEPEYSVITSSGDLKDSSPSASLDIPKGLVFVIVNPYSGNRTAPSFAEKLLLPLLKLLTTSEIEIITTEYAGHGVGIGKQIKERLGSSQEYSAIFILGGDGTTYEWLNGLDLYPSHPTSSKPQTIDLIVLPFGTANAFHASQFPPESESFANELPEQLKNLSSTITFLRKNSQPELASSLSLAQVGVASDGESSKYTAHVVVSAALHASILYDAELERTDPNNDPGDIEIFKRAAQKNLSRRYPGQLVLQGPVIEKYNPTSHNFEAIADFESSKSLDGPFAYLAGCLIDRFEPSLVVAPLRKQSEARSTTIDLLIFRPQDHELDPSSTSPNALAEWQAETIWKFSNGMYSGGSHIDIMSESDHTRPLVEYWRCSEFTWKPTATQEDIRNRVVCVDGDIIDTRGLNGSAGGVHVKAFSTRDSCRYNIRTWA